MTNQSKPSRTIYVREHNKMFEVVYGLPSQPEHVYCHYHTCDIAVDNAKALAEIYNLNWLGVK